MNTTTSAVLTALVVTAGYWSKDRQLTPKIYIGAGVYVLGLSILGEIDSKFAQQFGLLVLVSALMIYGVDVARKLGYLR